MESTVDWHFYSSSLLQTCFIVFVTYLLYSKTPKQVFFFNPIKIYFWHLFTHTLFTVFIIYTFFRLTFKKYFYRQLTNFKNSCTTDSSNEENNELKDIYNQLVNCTEIYKSLAVELLNNIKPVLISRKALQRYQLLAKVAHVEMSHEKEKCQISILFFRFHSW